MIMAGKKPRSMIVNATAGSGKTTVLCAASRLLPAELSVIFVAFNKKIQEELASRLPIGIQAKTFHAFALRQWSQHCWNMHRQRVQINDFKVKNAVEKHLGISRFQKVTKKTSPTDASRIKNLRQTAEDVCFLVSKAKIYGVCPRGYPYAESVTELKDDDYFWGYICDYYNYQIDVDTFNDTIEIARKILWQGLDNELEIDFDDMIYQCSCKGIIGEQYDVVLVDESQDLNRLQTKMLSKMVSPNGMIIAIGDRNQSCYGFRGSDIESMDNIKTDFNCLEFPLSISYRCPTSVVSLARSIYPVIESHPDALTGSVEYPEIWKIEDFKPGHLICCRTNAPTITLAYKLIKNKISAKVLGRDIGDGLIKLIRKLDQNGSLPELMGNLADWRDRQLTLVYRKNPDDVRAKEAITDKYECISTLCSNHEIKDVIGLVGIIDLMFTSSAEEKIVVSERRVTLSTIHRVKGSEADTVFILDSHLINPPWTRGGWQITQEMNLKFVAITRSKSRLIFINSTSIK